MKTSGSEVCQSQSAKCAKERKGSEKFGLVDPITIARDHFTAHRFPYCADEVPATVTPGKQPLPNICTSNPDTPWVV
jgi:hypothetical protein